MNFEFRDVQKWYFFICWKHVTAWIILLFYDFIRPHVEMLIRSVYDWCVKFLSSFGSHGLVEEVFLPVYINKNLIFFCLQSWSFLLHHHEPDIWKLVSLRALYQGKIDIYVCCFYSTI